MDNNSSKNTDRPIKRIRDVYRPTGNVDISNPPQGGSGVVEVTSTITKTAVNNNSGSSANNPSGGHINNEK